jgi:hypothetical protein
MRILITATFLLIALSVSGQHLKSDSLQKNLDKFVNREFTNLTIDTILSRLESQYQTPLNSIGKCIAVFSIGKFDADEKKSMTARIQEIATEFFREGSPIYLSVGGSHSVEWATEKKRNRHDNLTFVSLGNYCLVRNAETEFEAIFNEKTLALLGVKTINQASQEN